MRPTKGNFEEEKTKIKSFMIIIDPERHFFGIVKNVEYYNIYRKTENDRLCQSGKLENVAIKNEFVRFRLQFQLNAFQNPDMDCQYYRKWNIKRYQEKSFTTSHRIRDSNAGGVSFEGRWRKNLNIRLQPFQKRL